ncbi:hypothetical protein BDY19DRAFT_989878 [Irpex rosettiformis]|uniref:Uncharacterized protein n=1 Tax=Irpex rosettiformis TaxID=378272 RepID=A0ACB8UG03_9APHY|nr:hypothetical protein BDY19DRAFT_989878 [Irpex rosettiformis]
MSSTISSVTQTVTATVTASATAAAKPTCYNRWFHPQSCILNKIEMGFAFTALGLLALSTVLYLIAACFDRFSSGGDKKKKENDNHDEEARLQRDETFSRPSGEVEIMKHPNEAQEALVPPVRPSADYSNPFEDPYNERVSLHNPLLASYPTPYPSSSTPRQGTPQWTAEPEDVSEQHHLMPQPLRAGNAKPGFRESFDY